LPANNTLCAWSFREIPMARNNAIMLLIFLNIVSRLLNKIMDRKQENPMNRPCCYGKKKERKQKNTWHNIRSFSSGYSNFTIIKNQSLLTSSTGIKITGKISLFLRKTDISYRQRLQR
jgi:hypothetical protein